MPARKTPAVPAGGMTRRRRWLLRLTVAALVLAGVLLIVPRSCLALARSAISRREPEAALRWLERAAWFGQSRAETAFLRARCLRRLGRVDEFRQELERANREGYPTPLLDREQTLLLAQTGQLRQVESRMPRILQTADEDTAEVCEAYVNGLILSARDAEALRVIDSWTKDYPDDPYPELLRAQIYQNSGRYREAEAALQRALQVSQGSRAIQQSLGELLFQAGEIDRALDVFRELTADRTHRDAAWLQIARCERRRGHVADAQAALARILRRELLPADELALQDGLVLLDQQRYAEAVVPLERAKAERPREIAVRHALVQALRGCGRFDAAAREAEFVAAGEAELTRAGNLYGQIAAQPRNVEPRVEVGKILLQYGNPARGLVFLQSALNLQPDHREANLALAEYYAGPGQSLPKAAELAREYRARADAAQR